MPEELEKVEEKELSEQELADEEATFAGEDPPEKEEEKGEEEETSPKEEVTEEEPAEEGDEEEEEPEAEETETEAEPEEEEESAAEAAEKTAQELFGDEEVEEKPAAAARKPEPGDFKITKEEAAEYMDAFPVEELPEQIVIGDKIVNLRDLATDDDTADIFNAMAVVSGHLTKKIVAEALENAGLVKPEDVSRLKAEIDEDRRQNEYMAAVQEEHPDVRKIDRSKAFSEWYEGQTPAMQKMVLSPDPDHGVMALSAYKESIAKTKAAKHDKTASAKKERKDDLHKGSLRTKEAKRGAEKTGDRDDEKAGWDEAGKKK